MIRDPFRRRYHASLRDKPPVPISPHKVAIFGRIAAVKTLAALVTLSLFGGLATAHAIPLPRPRPVQAAIAPDAAPPQEPVAPSACRLRLTADLAIAASLPSPVGAGECGVEDLVRLEAIVLADKSQVAVSPPATMRCTFAEAIVQWVREDVVPAVRSLDTALKSIDNYASYDCRGRNRVVGAKLSEHGKANALDIRSLRLGNGTLVRLTDPHVAKDFREGLKKATCARFSTVLGPGSDGYHEDHVHVDLAVRRAGYGSMCRWEVREPGEEIAQENAQANAPATGAIAQVPLPRPRPTVAVKR
jgi:hypothetical protein